MLENEETEVFRYRKFSEIDVGIDLFKVVMNFLLVVIGIGSWRTKALRRKKQKNKYACQLMDKLVESSKEWEYQKERGGMCPEFKRPGTDSSPEVDPNTLLNVDSLRKSATPILVATKNGIIEMVKKILRTFPDAVLDVDKEEKNIVLPAAEHQHSHIYELMLNWRTVGGVNAFKKVDKNGNSALHLAANYRKRLFSSIPGAVLQMEWEIKWYKYVMQTTPPGFFATYNHNGETAQEIFTNSHLELVKDAVKSMSEMSQSFSVVAALVASVAYASSATVPGGTDQTSGRPILFDEFPFQIFTISALVALCFSVASLLMFLSIVSSSKPEEDLEWNLSEKLIVGLTTLFTAIAAMLISFCAGNFLGIEKELKYVVFAIYAVTIFLVFSFATSLFPLYANLLNVTFYRVPKRSQRGLTF